MTLDAILAEVKRLPRDQQAELLDELVCIVESDKTGLELTPAQREDLDRRIAEYERGEAKMIPGDEAIEMIRKRK
jgi:putative addiction module component (TIGR02574 family)